MESVKDVQGRDVREGEAGLHGGGDEHPGSGAGVRAAPDTVRKMLKYSVPPGTDGSVRHAGLSWSRIQGS